MERLLLIRPEMNAITQSPVSRGKGCKGGIVAPGVTELNSISIRCGWA